MTRRAVLAAAVLLAGVAIAPATAKACAVKNQGAFRTVAEPEFAGEATPVHGGFAVTPYDARRLYTASNKQVMQSTDGGCTWRLVFAVPDTPTAEQPYRAANMFVKGVRTPAVASGGKRVHLFLQEVAGYARPYVYTSADGSGAWTAALGLPPVGRIVDLDVAPSDPNVVYASILTGLNYLPTTYVSGDAGKTFTRATSPEVSATSKASWIEVDPADPRRLWATGNNVLSASTDGGRTWTAVSGPANVSQVSAFKAAKTALLAVAPGDARVYRSDDAGATWTAIVAPAGVQSAEFGATTRDVYVLSYANEKTDLWRYDAKTRRFVRAAKTTPVAVFFSMARENGRRPAFWGYSGAARSLVRWAP